MTSFALSLYHRMPGWARSVAASARGSYLNSWRYDAYTEKLVDAAIERESWDAGQWENWRHQRLSYILYRAATRVPYYRDLWSKRRRKGDRSSPEYLENWPVLEKQVLRAGPAAFLADDCRAKSMFRDHTSGTTGTSITLWSSEASVKLWYALFEARCRRWYGLSRNDRWAIFGGQLVAPVRQHRPPFWVWNAAMKQLYLSSYHLSPDLLKHYVDAIRQYRVRYILGYTSALYELACGILRERLPAPEIEVVITNAEPLYDFQREAIAAAFCCSVRETYGMAETVAAGSECEAGRLHEWPDAGVIERGEDSTEFICTGLINPDMPLIRYRVGDSGRFSEEVCPCGRTLPVIEKIEGRTDDLLLTRDGRRIGRLDPVFKGDVPVREAQIIQKSLSRIVVKLVPDAGYDDRSEKLLADRIRERVGDVEVIVEKVERVPRTERGKFRAVVCEVTTTRHPRKE